MGNRKADNFRRNRNRVYLAAVYRRSRSSGCPGNHLTYSADSDHCNGSETGKTHRLTKIFHAEMNFRQGGTLKKQNGWQKPAIFCL